MVVVPAKMGRLNRRMLLARLQRLGRASRAELAKSLGMSQPTAGKIADELIELGALEEVEDVSTSARASVTPTRLGRPGRMLRLNRTSPRFIGIQLGVTETSLAALPLGADEEDHWTVRLKTPDSAQEWARSLRTAAARLPLQASWGVLVSVPGIVDEAQGRVLFSPNLHWTEGSDLRRVIQEVWNVPVVVVQEERALALGHLYLEPENADFLLVDFGEGVGGAVIVEGQPFANPLPISGELGHTPVLGNPRQCGCGGLGCVETLVSTRGLLQSFGAVHRRLPSTWPALVECVRERGVEPWLGEALNAAAVAIAGALNVLGLRRVIITGSLNELAPAVLGHLTAAVRNGAMWARFGEVEVERAPRRRTAGLVAVGLDRLVLPMTMENHRPSPALARFAARTHP